MHPLRLHLGRTDADQFLPEDFEEFFGGGDLRDSTGEYRKPFGDRAEESFGDRRLHQTFATTEVVVKRTIGHA